VAEILGRPGNYRDLLVAGPLAAAGNALARVGKAPVKGRLRAESVMEGVLVTGKVEADIELDCARCLTTTHSALELDICELYVAPGHEVPPEEDSYKVDGLEVDLEPMLRDAVTLALPLNPICREDCKGLCGGCGKDLSEAVCTCVEEDLDPRWAALAELRDKLA
jgi:uncharacterized protein